MRLLRWLGSCALIISILVVGNADAAPVSKVIGLNSDATGFVPIPLTVTALCTSSCPLLSAPSYTDSNRFWGMGGSLGTGCGTSIDGGSTWSACATDPFVAGNKEHYAGAADGSVIAATQVGVECIIRRSTDNAVSWTTVLTFTPATGCGGPITGGTFLKCLSNGECTFPTLNGAACVVLHSTDNGQNWSSNIPLAACIITTVVSVSYNDSSGIMTQVGMNSNESYFTETGFNGWANSAVWPATSGNCWGTLVFNSTAHAICYRTGDASYTLRTSAGVVVTNLVMPNVVLSIDSGGLGMSLIGTNVLYVIASTTAPTSIGIYVSRDGGSTALVRIATIGAGVTMKEGDIFFANGCVYFSAGSIAPVFGKICR